MSISPEGLLPSHYRSRQEFLASLPPWRRLLSRLNWHPTIDKKVEQYRLEQRAIAHERRLLQLEKEEVLLEQEEAQRSIAHEQRMQQLRKENERLAELDSRIASLWPSSTSSSTQDPPAAGSSPT